MQPLDVSLYGPLKTYFSQFSDDFMVSNPGQLIAEKDLGIIFGKAYAKAATYENAVKGFEACGIEPFNSQCFSDADFAAFSTTDRKLESIEPPKELPKERQLNQAVQPVEVISEISRGVDQNNDVQDRPNNGSKTSSKIINRNNNDTQHNSNNNNEPVASCSFTIEPEE
ncbi:hypothetical protein JTB14_001717 [Gonioctena quinquepunctata]|nr:hypothetical protein JTB14_001717 [Gonioctena quinquepunctata]